MADITIVNGVYKPTYNWGAPSSMVSSPSGCTIPGMHIRDSGLRTSWIIMSCQTLRSFQLRLSIMRFGHVWMVGHVTQNFRHWKLDLPHQSILAFSWFPLRQASTSTTTWQPLRLIHDWCLGKWVKSLAEVHQQEIHGIQPSENGDNDKTQKKKGRY